MDLHKNRNDFKALVPQVSNALNLPQHVVEKDYWVTMMLKRMSEFEYRNFTVFKGGTSLSKGYGFIKRFSEDVDISLKPSAFSSGGIHKKTGEAIHKFIRKVRLDELTAIDEGKESEKQRYKRVYEFPRHFDYPVSSPIHDRVILEVNAFSNPTPIETVTIVSTIGEYIGQHFGRDKQAERGLMSFQLDALTPERSFCEKLLALRRAAHKRKEFLEARVRHLYDVFQLYNIDRISSFVESDNFEKMLTACYQDDELNQKISEEASKCFVENKLFEMPADTIQAVAVNYNNLRSITFDGVLPSIDGIINTISNLSERLSGFTLSKS